MLAQALKRPPQLEHTNEGGRDGAGEVLRGATRLKSTILRYFHHAVREVCSASDINRNKLL